MNKKCFSTLLAMLVITTLLVSATAVTAQIPDDIPEPNSYQREHFYNPGITDTTDDTKDVSLGEPGTSFSYEETIGVTTEPYPSDSNHLNGPHGLFIDSNDNLLVTEIGGQRLLEYDFTGNNILTIGYAGQPWHHDTFLASPRDAIIDGQGNIWIVILNALKQFDPAGNVMQRFPADDPWINGQDNNHFDTPQGIAFDSAGLLYIADFCKRAYSDFRYIKRFASFFRNNWYYG